MTRKLQLVVVAVITAAGVVGCMNMPTPPSQITGSYTSGLN